MIPGMYWKYLVNGDAVSEYEEKFIDDMMGYRLGQPRLRQLRMTKGIVLCYCLSPCCMILLLHPPLSLSLSVSLLYPPRTMWVRFFLFPTPCFSHSVSLSVTSSHLDDFCPKFVKTVFVGRGPYVLSRRSLESWISPAPNEISYVCIVSLLPAHTRVWNFLHHLQYIYQSVYLYFYTVTYNKLNQNCSWRIECHNGSGIVVSI